MTPPPPPGRPPQRPGRAGSGRGLQTRGLRQTAATPPPPPRHHKDEPASKIELMFKPHPELVRGRDYNQTRLLSTTVNATVDHISKYLALRIALDDRQTDAEMEDRGSEEGGGRRGEETGAAGGGAESGGRAGNGEGSALKTISEKHHTIYILTGGGQFSTLNGSLTLELVEEKYWKVRKPLEIHYAPTSRQPRSHCRSPPPLRGTGEGGHPSVAPE
ncbi:hypothetical protein CesoFtcFv8_019492 [Champsocephalus esox]|uniref:RING-type E3 ubiquitin transferase n=1 Tax=Champsocephalus esox TaxID=159716 RepID=A0AAN8BDA8_9TELE|nr:hypothetical protein CesoFtcFv8_019492 [Champsocephalus esox]